MCCSDCSACAMDRRVFLRTAGTVLGAAACTGCLGPTVPGGAPPGLVDAHRFRPRSRPRVAATFLRLPPPYWLGWPGAAYDLDSAQEEYTRRLREACRDVGADLDLRPAPVEQESDLEAYIQGLESERPDGVVVILQHMNCWPQVERIAARCTPTIVFAPVGTAFTGHVRSFSRTAGVYVVSSLDFSGVVAGLRMLRAKRQFGETTLLRIAGRERGEAVLEGLGTHVREIPRRTFNELFNRTAEDRTVAELAAAMRDGAREVVEPTREDLLNAARTFVTAVRLLEREGANALTMDCLGMVGERKVPTPPCMAWSMLQDAGVTAACEADLFGAVSLMLTSYLLDRPGFMNDPVPETVTNRLIAAHCTCGTRLNGFGAPPEPYILRSHSESDRGVAMQVLWQPGQRVSLVRFTGPRELILDTGTVTANIDTPPAGGCRTSFEIEMDDVADCRDVQGFHQVVVYGDHRREVEAFCQLYGIRVTHSS